MLKVSCIDHLNFDVRSFPETIHFYTHLFGFEFLEDCPDRNIKIIGNQDIKLCFCEVPEFELGRGLNHFGLYIENFDKILEIIKQKNIPFLYGGIVQWEKSRSIYIEDPNGYEIELSEMEGGGVN